MEVETFHDATRFRASADALLLRNEARNNLILGVTQTVIDRPDVYDDFIAWLVRESDQVLAAAARTPPYRLILADAVSEQPVSVLAGALDDLPGVVGTRPWVDIFVKSEPSAKKKMDQGIFSLRRVTPMEPSPGTSRLATREDFDLLIRWTTEFQQEATGESDRENVRRGVSRRIEVSDADAGMWLHEVDGEPVSMSGHSGRTPSGIRVGPVYTPPAHRGNGYASTLVATQSQWLLDRGRRFCFLYTDLANPTSNAIYRRIGYRQVAESAEYAFSRTT